MKTILLLFLLLFASSLAAQERGVTPVEGSRTAQAGTTYAVVVGISNYQDAGIPDLRFADNDALAFAGFLQSPAGGSLDGDHLKVLINEQATVAQFAMHLDWLWEVVQENDRVIIYFSGHGDVEKKSITQPGYLLCWDAPAHVYLAGGALNVRDLNDAVSTLSIQNKAKVILITDACRAGKLSGSEIGGAQATASNLAKQYSNEIKILSCQPDEYSIEGEQWGGGRGAFSYHLVDGLYGMADRNSDQAVSLMEVRGYLEEKVTAEVAPQNQLPMVIGDSRVKLADVFPDILAQIKEGKKGQLALFKSTESRGIEDDVLAAADSNIVKMYHAFKKALADKQFLHAEKGRSEQDYADYYYEKLIAEPSLQRLHSSMRRNYAAALQDDAQQVLNTMLQSGLTEWILKKAKPEDLYKDYPAYIDRAAALLGKDHYMYNTLQVRKLFYLGQIARNKAEKRAFYRKALTLQPDMVHAMTELIRNSTSGQLDSAEYFFHQSTQLIPSWVEPYLGMSDFYRLQLKQPGNGEEMLQLAGQVDSTSVLVWYQKANFYYAQKQYELAEKWYSKIFEENRGNICFPCAYTNLGLVYLDTKRFDLAEKNFRKAIEQDSTFTDAYYDLGLVFENRKQYAEAETYYKRSIEIDSTYMDAYYNLGRVYSTNKDYEQAKKCYYKIISIDTAYCHAYYSLGLSNSLTRNFENSEKYYRKAIECDSTYTNAYYNLGFDNLLNNRYEPAKSYFNKVILLDSTYWRAYLNLGSIYQTQEEWQESEGYIKKAIQFGPSSGGLTMMLVNTYLHLEGRLEDAKTLLDNSLEAFPNSPSVHYYLVQWYLRKEQPAQAWQYLELGLEKGAGRGALRYASLQEDPDFEVLRKDPKWEELMKKHFPDQYKE
ncbi:MAG: tetratricopeptide repeat protein [Bacteroidetes bacterium]|nr:MAG: tetratricopeptide repeat protein [Bacteroidota bacterium]